MLSATPHSTAKTLASTSTTTLIVVPAAAPEGSSPLPPLPSVDLTLATAPRAPNPLHAALSAMPVTALLAQKANASDRLVVVRIDDLLVDAVRVLCAHRVQAAFVIENAPTGGARHVSGALSFVDVLAFLAPQLAEQSLCAPFERALTALIPPEARVRDVIDTIAEANRSSEAAISTTIATTTMHDTSTVSAATLDRRAASVSLAASCSAAVALHWLATGGVARVLVRTDASASATATGADDTVPAAVGALGVLTAADVLRWTLERTDAPAFARLFKRPLCVCIDLGDAGDGLGAGVDTPEGIDATVSRVATISESAPLHEALRSLATRGALALAVISASGALVGSFSAKDVELVFGGSDSAPPPLLTLAVGAFCRTFGTNANYAHSTALTRTLGDTVRHFVHNRVHHVFLVNSHNEPIARLGVAAIVGALLRTLSGNAITDLFARTPALELAPALQTADERVIATRMSDTLAAAARLLVQYHLLCVPVVDTARPAVVGLLGVEDLVSYVAQRALPLLTTADGAELDRPLREVCAIDTGLVRNAVDFSGRNAMLLLRTKDTASQVLSNLMGGLHRVVLIDEHHKLRALCSQTDALRFMFVRSERADFTELMHMSLAAAGVVHKPVRSIRASDTMCTAIYTLRNHGGALAIVEDSTTGSTGDACTIAVGFSVGGGSSGGDALIGNLSMSDIAAALVATNQVAVTLRTEVGAFLRAHSPKSLSPMTVTLNHSVHEALRLFADSHLHHFFVIDERRRPIGILTQTDLLKAICETNL